MQGPRKVVLALPESLVSVGELLCNINENSATETECLNSKTECLNPKIPCFVKVMHVTIPKTKVIFFIVSTQFFHKVCCFNLPTFRAIFYC